MWQTFTHAWWILTVFCFKDGQILVDLSKCSINKPLCVKIVATYWYIILKISQTAAIKNKFAQGGMASRRSGWLPETQALLHSSDIQQPSATSSSPLSRSVRGRQWDTNGNVLEEKSATFTVTTDFPGGKSHPEEEVVSASRPNKWVWRH